MWPLLLHICLASVSFDHAQSITVHSAIAFDVVANIDSQLIIFIHFLYFLKVRLFDYLEFYLVCNISKEAEQGTVTPCPWGHDFSPCSYVYMQICVLVI